MSPKISVRHAVVVLAGTGGLVAGMILAVPGIANAATLTCGQTIMTSTKLTANLNCTGYTSGPAITIGADDVTLNLNGHKVLGPGDSYQTDGIDDSGFDYVTVENGSLSNFYTDVDIEGSSSTMLNGAVVRHISTTDNTIESSASVYGVSLDYASITHVSSADADYGVDLQGSQDSTVSGNQLNSSFYGLYDYEGAGNTWSGNTLTNVNYEGIAPTGTAGDLIEHNTVHGATGSTGVYAEGSTDITITNNTFTGVYGGVADFSGSDGEISDNTGAGDTYGIYTEYSTDYALSGNTFGRGDIGIETDYPAGEILTSNTVNDNTQDGVYVWTDDQTSGYSAELKTNTGNDNRFGLYSQIATTGSKNHASGNKVVNCYNVTCTKAKGGHSTVAPPHHPYSPRTAPALWAGRRP